MSLAADVRRAIRDVPDFPKPGILFKDITPVLLDAALFRRVTDALAEPFAPSAVTHVVAIESRGFILGAPVAQRLAAALVPVRKPGKLPSARMSVEYTLEYGENQLDIHADALAAGARAFVIDDLLATGGTARATAKLIELVGAEVAGLAFVIELTALGGRAHLAGYDLVSLLRY